MRTIVVASQKGGVGKTTVAGHLGVAAEMAGAGPVALIDTDPQGSLSSWWNERSSETPLFAQVDIHKLSEHLKALAKAGIKLTVIDTPPAVTDFDDLGAACAAGRSVVRLMVGFFIPS